jgi:uncharacterized membrane protein YedE/YeeE
MSQFPPSLFGGMLIGLSAVLFLALNGRVAGISGIVGRLAQGSGALVNAAFVSGLVLGPVVYMLVTGSWPAMTVTWSWPILIVAGLLVGIGTRMGSGCTSGHGVIGIAALSPRSIIATLVFLAAGIVTVTLMRWIGS